MAETTQTSKSIDLAAAALKDNADENRAYEGLNVQLNLNLSTNGQFGVDPAANRAVVVVVGEESGGSDARSNSLPPEVVEEYRRRKEEQAARRLEARKRRTVKRLAAGKVIRKERKGRKVEEGGEKKKVRVYKPRGPRKAKAGVKAESKVVVVGGGGGGSSGAAAGQAGGVDVGVGNHVVVVGAGAGAGAQQGSVGASAGAGGVEGQGQAQSQRVIEDAVPATEARSPPRVEPVQVQEHQQPEGGAPAPAPAPIPAPAPAQAQDPPMADRDQNKMGDPKMPFVKTRYGRMIYGILYRYNKAEGVKILCACHGHFFTPAEFVLHGGGGEVENPERDILIVDPKEFDK